VFVSIYVFGLYSDYLFFNIHIERKHVGEQGDWVVLVIENS